MTSILSNSRIVYLDFDGTLVDVRERLYRLFIFLTDTRKLSFETYWKLKKTGLIQRDMLKRAGYTGDAEEFSKKWLEQVEQTQWLQYDRKFDYTEYLIRALQQEYQCVLWTNRQSRERLLWELERMELSDCFEQILVTEQKRSKSDLIASASTNPKNLVIGDTHEDELAAKENGCIYMDISDALERYQLNHQI